MRSRITPRQVTLFLTFMALLFGILATASAASAATSTGWIRLGNLSQQPTPVDVYVYPSGSSSPQIVQRDVAYGTVLSYEPVSVGPYTVQVRTAGASPSAKPALAASLTVQAGRAYTVVPLRATTQGGQLKVLDDSLTTPAGKSLVRVIQAAFDQKSTTFHCSCGPGAKGNIVTNAPPSSVSAYTPIPPGTWTMTATGTSAKASMPITLTANAVRTEVVADGPSGIQILNLTDAVGAGQPPVGGVATGFGGTAPHGPGSPLPWLAAIGAGALLTLAGGLRLRRVRLRRSTSGV